jgi:hypothetical protein
MNEREGIDELATGRGFDWGEIGSCGGKGDVVKRELRGRWRLE